MCRILILADIRPMLWGISFHAVVVFGLGKDLLFKSVLGHCVKLDSKVLTISKYVPETCNLILFFLMNLNGNCEDRSNI